MLKIFIQIQYTYYLAYAQLGAKALFNICLKVSEATKCQQVSAK